VEETTTVRGVTQISPRQTLGTQNQWKLHREIGRFDLAPDETKWIAICEPIDKSNAYYRLLIAPNTPRLEKGKYRLKIRISAPAGQPAIAYILINEADPPQLETR
jgi:hypothetical protein